MPPQTLTIAGRPAFAPPQVTPTAGAVRPVPPAQAPAQAPSQPATPAVDPKYVLLAKAIRQTESGGNYQASGKSGEYGAYQFLPSTWDVQSAKFGVKTPLQQATREQQNEVAVRQLAEWGAQHPDWNIGNFASAWNAGAGKPNAYIDNVGVNSHGVAYDTPTYAKNVATAYQQIKSQGGSPQGQTQPTAPSAPQNPDVTPPTPKGDLLSGASDLLNTIFPNKNIGDLIGTEIAKLVAPANQKQYITPSSATLGNVTGDLLGDAAWLVGGGEAAPAIESASQLGHILPSALRGAKAGALGGSLSGAGNALSANGNLADAGIGALKGATVGGLTGGVLGGGLAALPGIAGRVANGGLQSESNIASDLTRSNLGSEGAFGTKNFTNATGKFGKNANATEDVVGKITQQSSPEDRAVATQAFQDVNTNGKIKSYSELAGRVQDAIDQNQSIVDKAHASNVKPVKLNDLGQKISAGAGNTKLTRTVNYVKDGLNQLRDFYNKTGDTAGELRIAALQRKATTKGLTSTEINGIAREHGRVLNGYNANGELASGLKKQAAENTRQGIKNTARSFLSSDAAKIADQKTSNLITLKGHLEDVQKGINNLANKVEKRGMIQKIAGGLAHGVNFATGGAPKAFFQKLFLESNIGNKSGNYLDFEQRLQRNLKILNRLNGSTDTDVEKFLRAVIGGLVTPR